MSLVIDIRRSRSPWRGVDEVWMNRVMRSRRTASPAHDGEKNPRIFAG